MNFDINFLILVLHLCFIALIEKLFIIFYLNLLIYQHITPL